MDKDKGESLDYNVNPLPCWIRQHRYFKECLCANTISTVNSEIFANCDVKESRLGHDLPISVNDRVILSFLEDFIFHEISHM